jgi:hypothetical protein
MKASHPASFRKLVLPLGALTACIPLSGAFAEDRPAADAAADPVARLKATLSSTVGFEVDDVRMADSGVACIRYRVPNDSGGDSPAQAVVEGDEVLRSTSRSTKFAKAWNSKCAKS